ncbi:MAG TPA: Maf family protein [Blastocatellia bacterium]|nr:Maf family protein [Blastocatellia bacterium]
MNPPKIILASASPRRAELLRAAGIDFDIRVANVNETPLSNELPRDYVLRLAKDKACAVARLSETVAVVLGADTTVVYQNEILGKPIDSNDARQMLSKLSGDWHEVITGVCLRRAGQVIAEADVTRVKFAPLSQAEIEWYVATQEPNDKAGSYAIQGYGSRFIERIEGNYSNVVGLPVQLVYRMLRQLVI